MPCWHRIRNNLGMQAGICYRGGAEVMNLAPIRAGDRVSVRTASNRLLERRAITGIVMGHDFEVVWVCREDEWEAARTEGRRATGLPWPADAVQLAGGNGQAQA